MLNNNLINILSFKSIFKIILNVLILISILYADNDNIGFKYGILAKFQSNPDSTIILSDSSVVHTGDHIQINVGYLSKSNFLLIFKGSKGEFWLSYVNIADINNIGSKDTTFVTALPFTKLSAPSGIETFYFINTYDPLVDLIKTLDRYEKAPQKAKSKIANKIQQQINELDPNKMGNIATIQNRLDKPMIGGVSFRGDEENIDVHELSVTHECIGSNNIAFKKIILNHLSGY